MQNPCNGCAEDGKCDVQAEKARQVLAAYIRGGQVGCGLRWESSWQEIGGVAA